MIEFTANVGGYAVTTRSDQTYFTVWYGERIAGTITRPQRADRHWSAYGVEGNFLGNGIGPRTALDKFSRRA